MAFSHGPRRMIDIPAWAQLNLPRHLALLAGLAIFSGIVVRVMISIGVPDHPDPRKSHSQVTPKSGGVGIVAAFLLGVIMLYRYGSVSRLGEGYFLGVIGAAILMAAVSFIDDLFDLSFLIKLGTQFAAAAVAIGSGLWVHLFALPYFGRCRAVWHCADLRVHPVHYQCDEFYRRVEWAGGRGDAAHLSDPFRDRGAV
jgi:hypothetical protein